MIAGSSINWWFAGLTIIRESWSCKIHHELPEAIGLKVDSTRTRAGNFPRNPTLHLFKNQIPN